MVVSTACGESRSNYESLCTVEDYGEEYFSQYGWPHSLRLKAPSYASLQLLTMIYIFAFLFPLSWMDSGCVFFSYTKTGCKLNTLR
jgi:hypothetical protein